MAFRDGMVDETVRKDHQFIHRPRSVTSNVTTWKLECVSWTIYALNLDVT